MQVSPAQHYTNWKAHVRSWRNKCPLSQDFKDAELGLRAKRIRVRNAKDSKSGNPMEAELAQAFGRLNSLLQPGQPLSNRTAWAIWPLVVSQDEKTRHLACRVLHQHHQDIKVRLADGKEHPISSVLLGVKHPTYYPNHLAAIRKVHDTVDLSGITPEGLEALQKIWEGTPMAEVIANDPEGKRFSALLQAADFFGCKELLEPNHLVAAIRAAYASNSTLRVDSGHVVLESSLASESELEEVSLLNHILALAKLSPINVLSTGSPNFLEHLSLLLQKDKFITDVTIKGAISNEGVHFLASLLERDQTLEHLGLLDNDIDPEGMAAIASALESNKALRALSIWNNILGPKGEAAISTALERNTTLQKLLLHHNFLHAEGAKALAEALKKNTTINQLQISQNAIGDDGAVAIAAMLAQNHTLQELQLMRTQIGLDGVQALSTALEKNRTLQKIDLSSNGIGTDEAEALASALEKNDTLQELCLKINSMDTESVRAIASALEKNNALRSLNLAFNSIGYRGANLIGSALEKNTSLQKLNLASCAISLREAKALRANLEKSPSLQQVNLRENFLSTDDRAVLTRINERGKIKVDF